MGNKIQEILDKYSYQTEPIALLDMKACMKEYAEWYAKKCLEIAANNAVTYSDVGGYTFVDTRSILNIKLPEHDYQG